MGLASVVREVELCRLVDKRLQVGFLKDFVGVHSQVSCLRMWTNHKRWLSYQGHVAAQPMSCPLAVPQGDPAGPLLLLSGCLLVADGLTSNSPSWAARDGCTSVFMDDRSFTASSVDSLKIKIQGWETWSTRVGLLESMSKGCCKNGH